MTQREGQGSHHERGFEEPIEEKEAETEDGPRPHFPEIALGIGVVVERGPRHGVIGARVIHLRWPCWLRYRATRGHGPARFRHREHHDGVGPDEEQHLPLHGALQLVGKRRREAVFVQDAVPVIASRGAIRLAQSYSK